MISESKPEKTVCEKKLFTETGFFLNGPRKTQYSVWLKSTRISLNCLKNASVAFPMDSRNKLKPSLRETFRLFNTIDRFFLSGIDLKELVELCDLEKALHFL